MGKLLLGSLVIVLILCAIIADLHTRSRRGVPDPKTTGITTRTLSSNARVGAAAQEITPFIRADAIGLSAPVELEKSVNPWLWLAERPMPDGEKPPVKKPLQGRFYLRGLIFSDNKTTFAILSVDLPLLRKEHLDALHKTLGAENGIPADQVLAFATGFPAEITVTPDSLAAAASRCLKNAWQARKTAELAQLEALETGLPISDARIPIEGLGGLDLAPLCGPVTSDKQYDAGAWVAFYTGSLASDSSREQAGLHLTRTLPPSPFKMLLFRAKENGKPLGALILAPVPPLVLPASAFNRITPDYPFPLTKDLEKKLECPCLLIRTPNADRLPVVAEASFSNVQRFGLRMSAALAAQAKKARFAPFGRIRAYALPVALPLKPWARKSEADLTALYERYRRQFQEVRSTSLDPTIKRELLDHALTALYLARHQSQGNLNERPLLKALAFDKGPLFIALPGSCESSAETGIVAESRGAPCLIASDLDGYISPVVPANRSDGGLRPNLSAFSPDAERRLIDRALELVRALRPPDSRP